MGKGSGRRPAQVSQDVLQNNYDRIFRGPQAEPTPPPQLPRCDECKLRHDPAIDCNEVVY
jgi:hypothetical protein